MNINLNVNMYHVVGAVATILFLLSWWFLRRVYKRIARRCTKEGCGNSRCKRVHYIYLNSKDKRLSIISASGKWRWFLRNVVKITLAECPCGWIRLVRIDLEPISLWHAWYTYLRDKGQYESPTMEHALVIYGALRKLYHKKGDLELDPQETDTPPAPDVLSELFKDIEELVQHPLGE